MTDIDIVDGTVLIHLTVIDDHLLVLIVLTLLFDVVDRYLFDDQSFDDDIVYSFVICYSLFNC